jgi:hypothetical protein
MQIIRISIPFRCKRTNIQYCSAVAGVADVWVELRAPRFVVHRNSAILRCEHNVDPDSLYKVSVDFQFQLLVSLFISLVLFYSCTVNSASRYTFAVRY